MEWVILDDGTDSIEDLLTPYKSQIEIQYIRSPTKLNIGAKRNRLHAAARGDILVCMDDDDYYPPERVSHAVTTLRGRRANLCGTSRNHLYFKDDQSIWAIGPYGPNHATFGTMAYTKKYATSHPCDETLLYAEETGFTRRYTEPLVQLDPFKTMLVLCHAENTFNKHNLRSPENPAIKKTGFTLKNFIQDAKHRAFYTTP
jgi:glycosyltransferase involved in cell wall biosynthesis